MKTRALATAGAVLILSQAGAGFAGESGWVLGPAFKPGWDPAFTLAATAGYLDPDVHGASGDAAYGLQFSLNCPWFQPPAGVIRQQFNFNYFDEGDLEMKTLEMNPRYFMALSHGLTIGVGPSIGYVWADADAGKSPGMWAGGLGADLDYRVGSLFFGIGTRYQWTQNKTVGFDKGGADNLLITVKVGVNF